MTEFKKLKELVATQLRPNCTTLFANDAESNTTFTIEALRALLTSTHSMMADATSRFLKLVSKAREMNPDKQIFNEKTSQAIIDEYNAFVALLAEFYEIAVEEDDTVNDDDDDDDNANNALSDPKQKSSETARPKLTTPAAIMEDKLSRIDEYAPTAAYFLSAFDLGPRMQAVELRFAAAVIAKSRLEADRQVLLNSLQSVEEAEAERRQLILMTEKSIFHTELTPSAAASKKDARSRQHAREVQLYQDEIDRRRTEMVALKSRVAAPNALENSLDAIKVILTRDANGDASASAAYKAFRRSLLDLVDEVINRPENDNIRMMRTDHHRLVATFGHPGIIECSALYTPVETVLGCVGYTIAYTKQPAHSAKTPQHVAELGQGMELPQGRVAPIHYKPVGYEPYSERLLVFQEPDPSEDPQLWCDWHEQASSTTAVLKEILDVKR